MTGIARSQTKAANYKSKWGGEQKSETAEAEQKGHSHNWQLFIEGNLKYFESFVIFETQNEKLDLPGISFLKLALRQPDLRTT